MNAPRLSHQLLDDDRVLVSCVGRAMSVHIAASEARRFAWSLLADLDPAEADFLGYTPPVLVMRGGVAVERTRGTGPWQRIDVLDAIRSGKDTAPKISAFIGLNQAQTGVQLNKLMKLGFVSKVTIGRAHSAGVWAITKEGLDYLDAQASREAA